LTDQSEKANCISAPQHTPRSLWITLKAPELIELKRISMDRDEDGALTFFRTVLIPRLRAAASQRGITLDLLLETEKDERIPR